MSQFIRDDQPRHSWPNIYADVLAFNRAVLPGMVDRTAEGLSAPPQDSVTLGAKLVQEEVCELMEALGYGGAHFSWGLYRHNQVNLPDAVDAIADILYVVFGVAARLGLSEQQFGAVWAEVRRANMDKANGPLREDGKRLKPAGWKPPNIKAALGLVHRCMRCKGEYPRVVRTGQLDGSCTAKYDTLPPCDIGASTISIPTECTGPVP
jgi:predicted HAD superfamily Cof-like phosphohydrolase